jgi:uncharacterized membrane protein YheB (UPF0754 family)
MIVDGGEKRMIEDKEKSKKKIEDVEEVKELLAVVSKEVPSLIKSILGSVFSEEAGRDMGKAAAAFYKELKNSGMPEEVAVKMTEDYVSVFTSLGNVLSGLGKRGKRKITAKEGEEIGEEISRKIREKLDEKRRESDEDEEEEEE